MFPTPVLLVNIASTIKSCAIHHRACYITIAIYVASTEKVFWFLWRVLIYTLNVLQLRITKRDVENVQYTHI